MFAGVALDALGHFHAHLLRKVADGERTVAAIQDDAQQICKDVAVVPAGTKRLSKLGTTGKWKGNLARDLWCHAKQQYPFLKSIDFYPVEVPELRSEEAGVEFRECPIMPPHETFALLWEKDRGTWQTVFGTDSQREQYWSGAVHHDWFEEHPGKDWILANPEWSSPVQLHGDDAAARKGLIGQMVQLLSFGSTSSGVPSALSLLLIFVMIMTHLVDGSLEYLYCAVQWSFCVMLLVACNMYKTNYYFIRYYLSRYFFMHLRQSKCISKKCIWCFACSLRPSLRGSGR